MSSDQTTFRNALLDARQAVPDGLTDLDGAPAGKRFAVYRNNVAVSLTEALQTGFPILEKLIGAGNFAQLAGIFLRAHPPQSPLMMHYGAEMPAFLEGFAPLQHLGYLPDVARLELGLRQSYHAADRAPVGPEALGGLSEDSLITLAPSAVLIPSAWPLHDIWRFNTEDGAPQPRAEAQHILILRPEFDPSPHALTPAEGLWIAALRQSETLGAALATAMAEDPMFDMTHALTLLVQGQAITAISDDTTTKDDHP